MDRNKKILGTFTGKCCDANVFNNNDMKLNRELFENLLASEEYKRAIKNKYYIGFLGHPDNPGCMDYRNACITMTECHMDENGEVFGSFDLVPTPVGEVVKAFIDAGVTFGISIRGAGDVDGEGNVDPETFVFRGFDLVTFPAYDDCVPEFQAIAASSELDKQVKYKKVCAAVKKNLTKITSAEALDVIQSQFKEGSDEYNAVSDRLDELAAEPAEDTDESALELAHEQLEGMTELFLEAANENKELAEKVESLEEQLTEAQMHAYDTNVECSRKISAFKRIAAAQIKDTEIELKRAEKKAVTASKQALSEAKKYRELQAELDSVKRSKQNLIAANTQLKSKISTLEEQNLTYVRKIEANSKTISQKESTISKLESDLRETVAANTRIKKETSNLDENVKTLQSRVEAAEQMVLDYQQAYANMYANALGVHISNLSITASTSVDELKKMIGSTPSSQPIYSSSQINGLIDVVDEDTIVTM